MSRADADAGTTREGKAGVRARADVGRRRREVVDGGASAKLSPARLTARARHTGTATRKRPMAMKVTRRCRGVIGITSLG